MPNLEAPALIKSIACLVVLIPPEALTDSPYGFTVLYINLTSSTLAPNPFLTKPVEVLTKSALPSIAHFEAVTISSFVNKSVSIITFKLWFLQISFVFLMSSITFL